MKAGRHRNESTVRLRGRVGPAVFLLLLACSLARAAPAEAQDGHILLPADSVEYLLAHAPFQLPDTLRDTRFEGDRTQRVALWFDDESGLLVQWARASRGGESFNNSPRYELAAYRLQKLFLDEPEYVVPPTEVRGVPLSWYRELDRRVTATFSEAESVLVLLQYWLYAVTDERVWDEDRFESDTAYARNWANANLLTYLIRHSDSNEGNLLLAVNETNPRVFAVDNGVAFESEISNRGTLWRSLHVRRFPVHTVERLRALTRDDLQEALGVLAEFRAVDGALIRVPASVNLNPGRGIRREADRIQLGLTEREIGGVWRRLERFVDRVEDGHYRTFVPGGEGGPSFHLAGEYGLWVSEVEDGRIRVAWLGNDAGPGFLRAISGDRILHAVETTPAQAHVTHFQRPAPGASLRIEYGIRGGPPHETILHLDDGARRPARVDGVDSLFVVGDVHGEYDTLVRLLRNAELVDGEGRWSGGGRHLALLGDLFDRGHDVTRTLWFLYRLEREAAAAGGGVHVVLGNHEVMVLTDDLRYVAPKEQMIAHLHAVGYDRMFDPRHSVLGRWLVSQPALLSVDDLLLAHGGVSPEYSEYSVEAFDDSLSTFVAEDLFYHMGALFDPDDTTAALVTDPERAAAVRAERVIVMDSAAAARRIDFFFAENSVFWFRDYVRSDSLPDELDGVLERHGARIHVVAHTPVEPIQSRYDGRLVAVDLSDAATEMALFVRGEDGGYAILRYTTEGPPTPLPEGSAAR